MLCILKHVANIKNELNNMLMHIHINHEKIKITTILDSVKKREFSFRIH